MSRLLAVWAGVTFALVVEGALAHWLPLAWWPDLGLLAALALGLFLPGASGLLLAWGVGWTEDLLSAAPLGQHALQRLLAWGMTRLVDRSIDLHDLRMGLGFAAFLTALDALVVVGLAQSLGEAATVPSSWPLLLAPRLVANALGFVFVCRAVRFGLGERAERGPARGALRLESPLP